MPKTLEIKEIDLIKKKAYTTNNNESFKLSPFFQLVIDPRLIITAQMNPAEQHAIIQKAIKEKKIKYQKEPGIFQIAGTVPAKIKITHKNWHKMRDLTGQMLAERVIKDLK